MPARLLPIYLNDHLAGSTFAVDLVQRTIRENEGTELADFLHRLLEEIRADRATLERLMDELGIPHSAPKRALVWTLEKVGRLKPNGRLLGYSPLSRLLELETLSLGIEGKRLLWLALAEVTDRDERLREFDFPALAQRALSQRERLEPHRLAAAREAF